MLVTSAGVNLDPSNLFNDHCQCNLLCHSLILLQSAICTGNEDLVDVVKNGDLTALLLDMCDLALHQVSSPATAASGSPDLLGCDQLWAALTALQAVLDLYTAAPPMTHHLCCDLMLLYTDIAQVWLFVARNM